MGFRSQMLLMILGSLLYLPFILSDRNEETYDFNVDRINLGLLVGSFLFGIGMQLADACASGTIWDIGEGKWRALVVMVGFLVGSVFGTWSFGFFDSVLLHEPVSLIRLWGVGGGVSFQMFLCLLFALVSIFVELKIHGGLEEMKGFKEIRAFLRSGGSEEDEILEEGREETRIFSQFFLVRLCGIEPLGSWIGSLFLAILNTITLIVTFSPWGISSAIALWSCKLLYEMGVKSIEKWDYWEKENHAKSLHENILLNRTTVMVSTWFFFFLILFEGF